MVLTRAKAAQAAAEPVAEPVPEPETETEDLRAEIAELHAQIAHDAKQDEIYRASLLHLTEQADLYQASLRRELHESQRDLGGIQRDLAETKQELSDALDAAAERERLLDEAECAIANSKRLMAGIERKAAQAADLETSLDAAQVEQQALRAQVDFLSRTLSDKQAELAAALEENRASKRELDQLRAEQIVSSVPPPPPAAVSVHITRICLLVLRGNDDIQTVRIVNPTPGDIEAGVRSLTNHLGVQISQHAVDQALICVPAAMDENRTYSLINAPHAKVEIHGCIVSSSSS